MTQEEGARRRRPRVRQINVAHVGMAVLFLTWLAFQIALGRDAVPQVLDLLLGSIGGIWFGMVVRDQGRRDEAVNERVDKAEERATRADERTQELERRVNDAE